MTENRTHTLDDEIFARSADARGGLSESLRTIRRHVPLFLAAVLAVPLLALLISSLQPPVYESRADVLISRQNLAASLNGIQDPSSYIQPERLIQTQVSIARSREVAERTLRALRWPSMNALDFLETSTVSPAPSADVLRFKVRDRDRNRAEEAARVYAEQFIAYRRELDTNALERARKEVVQRLQSLASQGDLYRSLVEKEQQLSTMQALQTSNATMLGQNAASVQVAPRPFRSLLLGIVLGATVGLVLVFLWDALDTRVRSSDEIVAALGLPLLGRIPATKNGKRSLAMVEDPAGPNAEAFRVLRANLELMNVGRKYKTIMVSSAVASEGKSTTIVNLAIALSRSGHNVALVDLDLRRPIVDKFFSLHGAPGITSVALGRLPLRQALIPLAKTGVRLASSIREQMVLDILPAGTVPPDAGEFINSPEIEAIVKELREHYDFVLVDAPPFMPIGDALTISGLVDGILVVGSLKRLERRHLRELRRQLDACPAAKIGIVVTGADEEEGYANTYGSEYYRARPTED
jgi:succinoglycan biosynthesis transport protein ExoP